MLLAKRVTGEEEVPEGCVAVVSPDAPDVLSHVSVRARNMRVLFAICHEQEPLQEIEKLAGQASAAPSQFQVFLSGAKRHACISSLPIAKENCIATLIGGATSRQYAWYCKIHHHAGA